MLTNATSNNVRGVALPQGTLRYHDEGTGPILVFIHGIFANSFLWQEVISRLSGRFRCIAPDLPLGGHSLPLKDEADLTPLGVAHLIADFIAALDLHDVTLIGNDTGGALCQLVIAHHPERIARLVLTNCDAYEQFFPASISLFHYGPRFFGIGFTNFLAGMLKSRFTQRLLVKTVSMRQPDMDLLDSTFRPLYANAGVRRDLTKFLRGVSNRYTLAAARAFPDFHHPVLLVWGKNDLFFPSSSARHLQRDFPDATLKFVSGSRTFVPLDQPDFLVQCIEEFVNEPIPS